MVSSEFTVSPWRVEGRVDYEKLISEFKVRPIDLPLRRRIEILAGSLHVLLRRNIAFAHRDLDLVLDDFQAGKGFCLYTGRAPSLGIHIGHLLPFLLTQWFQEKFKADVYIEIADDEKVLSGQNSFEDIKHFSFENILDIIAVGFDPDHTFIFRDTEYIRQLYPLALKIGKRINFSQLKAVFGFENSTSAGLLFYPLLQIASSMLEQKRCLIPAGIDQDPYWRLQRDIASDVGHEKAAQVHLKFLPPLTGLEGKMSSSQPEAAIYLSDDPKEVRRKIEKYAFSGGQPTVKEHRKLGGDPDVDVSYLWMYFVFEPDDQKIRQINEQYRHGEILSGEMKEMLIQRLNSFLEAHRLRRDQAKSLVDTFMFSGRLATQALKGPVES
jgi:tryptophanyl-tRNA synthetase